MTRWLEVDPGRIDRWITGFGTRHGAVAHSVDGPRLRLTAADGAVASLEPFAPVAPLAWPTAEDGGWAAPPSPIGLVLLRRGGYAVGLAHAGELTSHKCGTRYVQGRTAAGGWSQQRFARRRGNQADALVAAVAEHVIRLVLPGAPAALVAGGDKGLVRELLADPRLGSLVPLPRRELFDLPNPRLEVLRTALRRGRAVRVVVDEPPVAGPGSEVAAP